MGAALPRKGMCSIVGFTDWRSNAVLNESIEESKMLEGLGNVYEIWGMSLKDAAA